MRNHYLDVLQPDEDDRVLFEARANGTVPGGCLLGGTVLEPLIASGLDPCGSCSLPNVRVRCGGRPQQPSLGELSLAELPRRISNDEAGARAVIRSRYRAGLDEIVRKAKSRSN